MGIDYIKPLEALIYKYSHLIFSRLSLGALALFGAFFACWLLWQIIWKGMIQGTVQLEDWIKPLITYSLIFFFLNVNNFFGWIYDPLLHTTTLLLKEIMTALNLKGQTQAYNIWGMMETIDSSLHELYKTVNALLTDGGFFSAVMGKIAGLILCLPFVFLWAIFLCFCFDYMFKLLAVSALSPLLIIFGGFEKTRFIPLMGFKMVLQGILTLFVSVIGMGLAVMAIKNALSSGLPIDGQSFKSSAPSFAFSSEYWGCFVVACLAIYFQLKAPTIASIVGFSDGPGSAGFVAGSIAAAYTLSRSYVGQGVQAAGRGLGHVGSELKERALNPVLDKMRGRK